MKKITFILGLFLSATFSFASDNPAIDYNDKIIIEQNKIGTSIKAFSQNPNDFTLDNIHQQVKKSLVILDEMQPFNGNKKFLKSAKNLFKFYLSITQNEYKEMLDLIINKNNESSEVVNNKITILGDKISKKEDPLDDKFQTAQIAFAKENNFTLTPNQEEKTKEERTQKLRN